MKKQLEQITASNEQLKAERDAEKKSARDGKLRNTLTEKLTRSGIDPKYVGHAVGILVDVQRRVRFADDEGDDIVFGDLDLDTGLKDWVRSDDAKIYLPPRGTHGSGDPRNGKRPPPQGAQPQPGDIGRALLAHINGMPITGARAPTDGT